MGARGLVPGAAPGMTARVIPAVPTVVAEAVRSAERITVLTGAGMSAESGVPTFREAGTGLWARYDPMTLASPEAFEAEPELVWAWYAWRRLRIAAVHPNAGHRALADWSSRAGPAGQAGQAGRATTLDVVTQNVDDLHERAGSRVLAHLHGSLAELRCFDCGTAYDQDITWPDHQVERLTPPRCACGGFVRPGIVWFGEPLPIEALTAAERACRAADVVLVVGTSGLVHPAAGLPVIARAAGAVTVEINPAETALTELVHHAWRATAATALPALLESVGRPDQQD